MMHPRVSEAKIFSVTSILHAVASVYNKWGGLELFSICFMKNADADNKQWKNY
jgi:hypothetical protein